MAKKGQTFKVYTEEEKMEAVRLYETGVSSREVARRLGIPEKRQVLDWVNKVRNGEALAASRSNQAWRKGRPKTNFKSLEEELAYIFAPIPVLLFILSFPAILPKGIKMKSLVLIGLTLLIFATAVFSEKIGFASAAHPVISLGLFLNAMLIMREMTKTKE